MHKALKVCFAAVFVMTASCLAWAQPAITNVLVTASTATTATIQWTTDVPATSQVLYGQNYLQYNTNKDLTLVTSHTVVVKVLTAGPVYMFAVVSVNAGGQQSQSATSNFSLCGAPFVPVTGTVNNYYEYGSYTLTWVPPTGGGGTPTVCGQSMQTTITGSLSGGASFSDNVADSYKVVPGPGTWQVRVTDVGNLAPVTVTVPLSSTTQDVSAPLQAAASVAGLTAVIANTVSHAVYPSFIGGGSSVTFGSGVPSGACTQGSSYYNIATIPYSQYVCGTDLAWHPSGSSGGGTPGGASGDLEWNKAGTLAGVTPSQPLYNDPPGILESGAGMLAAYGCEFYGDSNSGGAGLGNQYSWVTLAYNALNCKAPTVNIPINVAGDNTKDFANRTFMNDSPLDQGNKVAALQYSTNTLKYEGNTVPTTARKLSYQTTLTAGISNLAMSVNDKYMPTTQPTISTSYAINSNNVVTMQALNGYYPGQQLLVTGCTSTTGLLFNAINTGITVLTAAPTSFTFTYNTNYVPQTSTTDTCTISPSVYWTLSGGWSLISPFDYFNFTGLGAPQGIGYQVGNQLTIPCSGSNAVATITQVVTTTPTGIFTINITSVDGGGHITGVSLNSPGTASPLPNSYWFVVGGTGDAIIQNQNILGTYVPNGVTLISGGTGGYSVGSSITVSAQGQLYAGAFKISTLGAGCVNNASFAASCSVGTGTSCGQFGNFSNTVGPQMYRTSTGGTMTLSSVNVGGGADLNTGGDIKVWYPVGPNYGGSFTVTADGGSPLVDTWTGTSTILEVDGTPEIPENFPTGDTFQEAHFKVTPGTTHTFVITCTAGTNCGMLGMGIPPSTHNTGVNSPNATVGGALLIGNSGPAFGTSSCGQTAPLSCATVFSNYITAVVNEQAKVEGLNVNYFDNQNILPVFDYLNNGLGTSTLIQNRVSNSTNSLHGDSSFHVKMSNNLLAALKAVPAPSTTGNFPTGVISYTNSIAGQYSGFFSTPPTPLTPPITPGYTTTNAAYNLFAPIGFSVSMCNYPAVSGQNPNFYGPLFTCPHLFTSTEQRTLANQVASGGTSYNSLAHTFTASVWDAGAIIVSQTGGTGCTGTGTITPTGGTFTTAMVLQSQCNSGVIAAQIANAGVYTVAPTGFTNTYAGSVGYNITFDLATNNTPAQVESWALASQVISGAPTFRIQAPYTSFTGGTINLFLTSAAKGGGYKFLMDAAGYPTAYTFTTSLAGLTTNTQWNINGITGTPMVGASTSPIVSAACLGTNSSGAIILGTCTGSSPLTTKGDLYGFSTVNARIPIGTDGFVLTADSTQALGLKWAAASGGVASVFGRTGAVVAASGDYTVGQVTGAVSAIGVTTANGVSGTSSGGTTPNLTFTLGAITPSSVTSPGVLSGSQSVTTGTFQGSEAFGVGTGTIPSTGLPTNYVGILGPASGTPSYWLTLPSANPTAGQYMVFAAPTTINGQSQAVGTWASPGSGGTVNSGTIGQVAYYAATGTAVSGETNLTTAQLGSGTPAAGAYVDGAAGAWTALPFKSLTTTGTSGAATLVSGVLNIPNYAGGGTVTTFSAGNLAPLFTTSVATATFTPALTFTASNFTAHQFYGNNTGSTGTPAAFLIGTSDFTPNSYIATTGAVNVMVATLSPAATALVAGLEINVLPNLANTTTTPTINVNGLGAKNITKLGTTALAVGDMTTTAVASLIYDGTEWQLQNPQVVATGSGTVASGTGIAFYNPAAGTTVNGANITGFAFANGSSAPTVATFAQFEALMNIATISGAGGALYINGDSVMQGLIGSNSNNSTTQYAETLPGLVDQMTLHQSYPGYNLAVAGTNSNTIFASIYKNFPPPNPTSLIPKLIIDNGINDAINNNGGGTPSTASQSQYTSGLIGVIGHVLVPVANHFAASTCTQTTGTWANNSGFFGNQSAWSGTDLQISSSGAVLTCSFTTTANNQRIIAIWGGVGVSSGGQFNLAIDGTNQTALCSGTTTYGAFGCNASSLVDRYGQDFTIATSGAHTLTITTTNASAVDFVEYLLVPTTLTPSALMVISGVPTQHSSASAAVQSAATVYDGLNSAAVTAEAAGGILPVAFANVRTGSYVINNSTDYTGGGCSYNLGLIPNHPDCIGVAKWANSIAVALNSLGSYAYPGLGQVQLSDIPAQSNNVASTYYTNFVNGWTVGNPTCYANFNCLSNINGNSIFGTNTTWAPGIQFDTNGSSYFQAIVSSISNASLPQNLGLGFLSTNGWGFGNCAATATNPSTCTGWPLFLTSTGQLTVANSSSGTGATHNFTWATQATPTTADLSMTAAADSGVSTVSTYIFQDTTANTRTGALMDIHTVGTSTALPLQVTAQGTANGIQMSSAGLLASLGTGSIKANTVNGNTFPASAAFTSGGLFYASSTSAAATSALITANCLVKSGGAGVQPSAATLCDTGTLSTLTDSSGLYLAPASLSGAYHLKQGTTQGTQTTAITHQAPTAVTSYIVTEPGAISANNNMVKLYAATSGTVTTESFVQGQRKSMLTSAYTNATTTASTIWSFAVDASTQYTITCKGLYKAATGGTFSLTVTGPASPTLVTYDYGPAVNLASNAPTFADYNGTGAAYPTGVDTTAVTAAATDMPFTITFGFTNGVTAGTFAIQGATLVTNTLTVEAGSYCVAY